MVTGFPGWICLFHASQLASWTKWLPITPTSGHPRHVFVCAVGVPPSWSLHFDLLLSHGLLRKLGLKYPVPMSFTKKNDKDTSDSDRFHCWLSGQESAAIWLMAGGDYTEDKKKKTNPKALMDSWLKKLSSSHLYPSAS